MEVGATVVDIGAESGVMRSSGSPRIMLNLGAESSTVTVHNSASASYTGETDRPPIRILAALNTTDIYVRRGRVGIACNTSTETATIRLLNIGYIDSRDGDASVVLGDGVTLATVYKTGGSAIVRAAAGITTVTNRGGMLTIEGSAAITTLTVKGGTVIPNSSGTITTLNADGGTIDFTRSNAARTVTTLAAADGSDAIVRYNPAAVTVTNKLAPAGPVSIQLGQV
jgi:hypothetical protein